MTNNGRKLFSGFRLTFGRARVHFKCTANNTTTKGSTMPKKQTTILGTRENVAGHGDDIVVCSDGSERFRSEAVADCAGGYHRNEEGRDDADVAIVTKILEERGKGAEEYCTENSDYPDGYFCCITKSGIEWRRYVEEWIFNEAEDVVGPVDLAEIDGLVDAVVSYVCAEIDVEFDCEPEPNYSDYAGYGGDGCCLYCLKIEEREEQIGISDHPEFQTLHDDGRLDDVLDNVNCDVYICRSRRREKNEETGRYEEVGRETYQPYNHSDNYPCFEIMVSITGGWDFVIPAERMRELLVAAILDAHGYEVE